MGSWILILTVVANTGAPAVTTAPGFGNLKSCEEAGEKWKQSMALSRSGMRIISSVCVDTTEIGEGSTTSFIDTSTLRPESTTLR